MGNKDTYQILSELQAPANGMAHYPALSRPLFPRRRSA